MLQPYKEECATLAVRRIGPGSVLVQEPEGLTWLGVRTADALTTPCQTDAALLTVTPTECSLVQATYFGYADSRNSRDGEQQENRAGDEEMLFCTEHPVDIAFDWSRGRGTITATLPTLLTFHHLDATAVMVDGAAHALRRLGKTVIFGIPPGRHTLTLTLAAPSLATTKVKRALTAAWQATIDSSVARL